MIMRAWVSSIRRGESSIEAPSATITLALAKARGQTMKKHFIGKRSPSPSQATGNPMAALHTLLTLEAMEFIRERKYSKSARHDAMQPAKPPPLPQAVAYQSSSPANSSSDRTEVLEAFIQDFVSHKGSEFKAVIEEAVSQLSAQRFGVDDFKRSSENGKVTMEDWLEVGGPKAMIFRIQEAVPIWKESVK
jgi:hypothetical protein